MKLVYKFDYVKNGINLSQFEGYSQLNTVEVIKFDVGTYHNLKGTNNAYSGWASGKGVGTYHNLKGTNNKHYE